MSAPALETERLWLRPHRREDLADAVAMWGDPAVTRFIGGKPSTPQQCWMRLLNYAGHWALQGFGYWAIEEKATGRFVGEAGFADFHRELEPSIAGVPELGWALTPAMHGRGYATEALRAAIAWGDQRFGRSRTVCIISPGNAPSLRVAEKLGYREECRAIFAGEPTILFGRTP